MPRNVASSEPCRKLQDLVCSLVALDMALRDVKANWAQDGVHRLRQGPLEGRDSVRHQVGGSDPPEVVQSVMGSVRKDLSRSLRFDLDTNLEFLRYGPHF